MSPSLPPNANLTQLKNQAKDILKAHQRGDLDRCSMLGLLRQFADASGEDVLSTLVKLDDAQFALAMHYGFKSWAAMKKHVEALASSPPEAQPKRPDDGKVIAGFEGVNLGGSFTKPLDSFSAAAAAVLRGYGMEVAYEQVMGYNGFAFSGGLDSDTRAPWRTLMGIDIYSVAALYFGFDAMNWYPHVPRSHKNLRGELVWPEKLAESIDQGLAAMAMYGSTGQWHLVCGYRDGGRTWITLPYPGKQGYQELTPDPNGPRFLLQVVVFRKVSEVPPRRQAVVESLGRAVEMARPQVHDPGSGRRMWGRATYDGWIEGLRYFDGKWTDELRRRNAAAYFDLMSRRATAANYLRGIADGLGSATGHLRIAAGSYQRIVDRLDENRSVTTYPFEDAWMSEHRARQADLLEQCLADENAAVAQIEQALAALE